MINCLKLNTLLDTSGLKIYLGLADITHWYGGQISMPILQLPCR